MRSGLRISAYDSGSCNTILARAAQQGLATDKGREVCPLRLPPMGAVVEGGAPFEEGLGVVLLVIGGFAFGQQAFVAVVLLRGCGVGGKQKSEKETV